MRDQVSGDPGVCLGLAHHDFDFARQHNGRDRNTAEITMSRSEARVAPQTATTDLHVRQCRGGGRRAFCGSVRFSNVPGNDSIRAGIGSPADFTKLIAEETDKWGKVIKFAASSKLTDNCT